MSYLILVRHGESRWNLANKFTGWVDVPLSRYGVQEAVDTAKKLKNIKIDQAFVSHLERAHETLTIILSRQEMTGIFLHHDERKENWYLSKKYSEKKEILTHSSALLNERYYGDLQGLNKNEVRKKYGEEKVLQWRRGYAIRPPGGESIEDVYKRTIPYFTKRILPLLKQGKNVILVSHGNVMRTILKHIEDIPVDYLPHLDLPSAKPIIYKYGKKGFSRTDGLLGFNRPLLWDHEKVGQKKRSKK
ncbi:MAG: 2,3-bisphosphoglycerate-dependent phosphoglycerate mutase [Patescibacteria group bacterium]|nr:2,3-bisphosphoglycerate-dependent phosphoglycerate mutase [Patescibacteria group bacterium]